MFDTVQNWKINHCIVSCFSNFSAQFSGVATGGRASRTTFEICLNPLRNWGGGVTLIRFHVQLIIIRNVITEDAGILDRIMML